MSAPTQRRLEFYDYLNAKEILEKKGLLSEIEDILHNIKSVDPKEIQNLFRERGWEIEKLIFEEAKMAWDAYKNGVVVSIEFSLIDAVHRDFLRLLLWRKEGKVDVALYITTTFKEPKFQNVQRDIALFKSILDVPIYLIGLSR